MKLQETADHITNWLKDYALHAGVKGFVVGVSGGIDSALTSTLCALTGLDVLTLEMPIHQNPLQASLGRAHQQWLKKYFPNTSHKSIELSGVYDHFVESMQPGGADHELSLANTRARLRMSTLYYHGQANGLLVAGTGNKVEDFGVGFYTKYGDGGVDISPIADCTKTQVWDLGKYLGIDNKIIEAEPTDGLWDDARTDIDQLGMSYQDLEKAMSDSNDSNYKKYLEVRKKNLHKMIPIPVCKFDE